MTTLMIGLLAVLGGAVLLAAGLAWAFVRRLRRFGSRWGVRILGWRQAIRPPGPGRDAVRLRRQLQAELLATHQMLDGAPAGVVFRADARELLADINSVAAELDRDLRSVERFVDPVQQKAALGSLKPQVDQLVSASYTARQTIIRTAVADRRRALDTLSDRVAGQAQAADRYRRTKDELAL